jgi:hypothetical protein
MKTKQKPLAALNAVIVAVSGLVMVGCTQAGTSVATGSASSAPPVSPTTLSPTPSVEAFQCLGGTPCLGKLAAGRYGTTDILVPFSYVVPAGWENPAVNEGSYMLQHQGSRAGSDDAVFVWPDPVVASQDPCTKAAEPGVGRSVDAIVAWLTAHPGLITTEPTPVTIGGLDGQMLDVRKDPAWTSACTDGTVNLFVHEGTITDPFWWAINDKYRERYYFLDAGNGRVVLIDIETVTPDTQESFLAEAVPIVESFDFTPG